MCSFVPGEVLRQCSAANPADIIIRAVHDCPILYFMPVLTLLFVRLCIY